jgi:N-acetylneuraminic acid mutarotase
MVNPRDKYVSEVLNGMIYIVGGRDNDSGESKMASCEKYDTALDEWTSTQSLPTGADGQATAVIDDILYVVGGNQGSGTIKILREYNPTTNTWITRANAPRSFENSAADAFQGRMYVTMHAGYTCFSYDPKTNTWTSLASPSVARTSSPSYVADGNGRLFLFGGNEWCGTSNGVWTCQATTSTEAYHVASNTWQALADLPTPRVGPGVAVVGSAI